MYPARAPAAGPCPARYRLRSAGLFAALLLVLWAQPCAAEPALQWRAPTGCPQQAAVTRVLRAHWSETGTPPQLSSLTAQVRGDAQRGYALALSVQLEARTARRLLHARRCAELVDAAVWLITLLARPQPDSVAHAAEESTLTADFDGEQHVFDRGELGDLAHAYAISIHKSQGSEYPVVVVPLLKAHFMMLQRNLLYTAITRGKKKVLLVGEPAAFAMAVRNNESKTRCTHLRQKIAALG